MASRHLETRRLRLLEQIGMVRKGTREEFEALLPQFFIFYFLILFFFSSVVCRYSDPETLILESKFPPPPPPPNIRRDFVDHFDNDDDGVDDDYVKYGSVRGVSNSRAINAPRRR